jgi:hypothetical protein
MATLVSDIMTVTDNLSCCTTSAKIAGCRRKQCNHSYHPARQPLLSRSCAGATKADVSVLRRQPASPSGQTSVLVPAPNEVATVATNQGSETAQVGFPVVGAIACATTAHGVLRINGTAQSECVPMTSSDTG